MILIANCGYPDFELLLNISNESIPRVMDYNDDLPAREGTTIIFSCPPGLDLIGSSSATCTGNGEWEPDLRTLLCDNLGKLIMIQCCLLSAKSSVKCFPCL
jgi:hypothetical protein